MEDKRLYIDFYYLFSVTCNDCFITVSVNALLLSGIAFIGLTLYSIWKKLYSLLSALIIAMLYTSFHFVKYMINLDCGGQVVFVK